jgi:hypothetical protein
MSGECPPRKVQHAARAPNQGASAAPGAFSAHGQHALAQKRGSVQQRAQNVAGLPVRSGGFGDGEVGHVRGVGRAQNTIIAPHPGHGQEAGNGNRGSIFERLTAATSEAAPAAVRGRIGVDRRVASTVTPVNYGQNAPLRVSGRNLVPSHAPSATHGVAARFHRQESSEEAAQRQARAARFKQDPGSSTAPASGRAHPSTSQAGPRGRGQHKEQSSAVEDVPDICLQPKPYKTSRAAVSQEAAAIEALTSPFATRQGDARQASKRKAPSTSAQTDADMIPKPIKHIRSAKRSSPVRCSRLTGLLLYATHYVCKPASGTNQEAEQRSCTTSMPSSFHALALH